MSRLPTRGHGDTDLTSPSARLGQTRSRPVAGLRSPGAGDHHCRGGSPRKAAQGWGWGSTLEAVGLRLACRLSWAPSQPWAVSQGPGMRRAGSSPGPCELRRLPAPARQATFLTQLLTPPASSRGWWWVLLSGSTEAHGHSEPGFPRPPRRDRLLLGETELQAASTSSAPSQNQAKRLHGRRAGPRRALGPGPRRSRVLVCSELHVLPLPGTCRPA